MKSRLHYCQFPCFFPTNQMAIISEEAFLSSMANPDWPEPATMIHSSLEMALWHI